MKQQQTPATVCGLILEEQQVSKQNYPSLLRPENGLNHFWFAGIVIASIGSFPLSDKSGWNSFTWYFNTCNLLYWSR